MKILLVDDDENILHGYHRNLHRTFDLEVAMGAPQALLALEKHGPFAVVVSDMRMPGMSGMDLLRQFQRLAPDTTRIMLTGDGELKTAMDAVNQGQVFRFLTKPCSAEILSLAIHAGIRQHQLVVAEKELLQQTLMGSLQVLMDLLSNLDPETFGRGKMLRERVILLAQILEVQDDWALETASLLLPLGRLALPPELLAQVRSGARLALREQALFDQIPAIGSRLLGNIPRMEPVAKIILYHAKGFDGSGFPVDGVQGQDLPMGARILKVLNDFTTLEQQRRSRSVALEELANHPAPYDPRVLAALQVAFPVGREAQPAPERECGVEDLKEGMVLTRSVLIANGRPVLLAGIRLGAGHLELLGRVGEFLDLQETIWVRAD